MAAVLPPSAAGASALLTAAAGSSIAAVAPGIEQDKLEKLIQDAVRKVSVVSTGFSTFLTYPFAFKGTD